MTQPNPSTAMARAILDELARGDMALVVISPGSRSTALALAADEHPALDTVVALDERSGAFHALGRAKVDGLPTAVVCTSGTAAANYFPAVIEAEMSLTPLVVLTADRPDELRGVGANQTIDQVDLYGGHVRFFADIEAPDGLDDSNERWRVTAAEAIDHATGLRGQPGPVHLNVGFREPTVPVPDDGRSRAAPYEYGTEGRGGGRRWIEGRGLPPSPADLSVPTDRRGLVVAGEGKYDRARVRRAAETIGWPVLATAQSGLRGPGVVSNYHHILAKGIPHGLKPDVVYAIGAVGPSLRLQALVDAADESLRIDSHGRHIDPNRSATQVVAGDPAATLENQVPEDSPDDWADSWIRSDEAVGKTSAQVLASSPWSGPRVAATLNELGWDRLVVASSLPIRDVDAHLSIPGQVIANRGASGIDGFVSTTLGAASAGGRTLSVAGDLSLLHDANGFLIDTPRDAVFVVLDNGGGGLFDLLPQAVHAPSYERLFVAPPNRSFLRLAEFHGLFYEEITDDLVGEAAGRLAEGGIHLLRVEVDREVDRQVRADLDDAAIAALDELQA